MLQPASVNHNVLDLVFFAVRSYIKVKTPGMKNSPKITTDSAAMPEITESVISRHPIIVFQLRPSIETIEGFIYGK